MVKSAETLGHPLSLAQTLCYAAFVHIFRREPSAAADYAGRASRICEEQRIAHYLAFALCADGWALSVSGKSEKGLAQVVQGVDGYGPGANQHMLLALQADAQLAIGEPEAALASVIAGLKAVEKTGGAPLEAELHRLRGEALLAGGRDAERGRDGHRQRHRRRAPPERKVLGIAQRDEPRPLAPAAGPAARGGRPARPGIRLVYRRVRYR